MDAKKVFIIIGVALNAIKAVLGIVFYLIEYKINFLFLAIGLSFLVLSLLYILIYTNYEPFEEFSCWALILSLTFLLIGLGYFPWDLSSPHLLLGLYTSTVSFSWAGYLTTWNVYTLIRKKKVAHEKGAPSH